MFRVTAAIPRLIPACAVLASAVVVQRRNRKTAGGSPQLAAQPNSQCGGTTTRAAATLAAPAAATSSRLGVAFMGGSLSSGLSTALVRTFFQVLQSMWLSVAIGAAASLATVNAKMVATIKQLQVCLSRLASAATVHEGAVCSVLAWLVGCQLGLLMHCTMVSYVVLHCHCNPAGNASSPC